MIPLRSTLQVVQNFMDISQRTGGDYCLLRKDPDLCFRKAVDYSSRFYMLTYYAQPAKTAEWRKIRVKVRGTNLEVRARSGYFRSEEHTSELQSRGHLVCRLLLEKKK